MDCAVERKILAQQLLKIVPPDLLRGSTGSIPDLDLSPKLRLQLEAIFRVRYQHEQYACGKIGV